MLKQNYSLLIIFLLKKAKKNKQMLNCLCIVIQIIQEIFTNNIIHKIDKYAGGLIHNLQWANPHCGIHDRTHFGTLFANETFITFSKEGLKYLPPDLVKRCYRI
jgi:hypothetical protein